MPDILHRVGINAKPERVFQALTTVDGLKSWWISKATGDATAGGTIDFRACEMKVLEAKPNELVHWRCVKGPAEWLNTDVKFSLTWKDEQTFVLFTTPTGKNQ
jgi:uncharacterized protein YndB with AHSA1/START domain